MTEQLIQIAFPSDFVVRVLSDASDFSESETDPHMAGFDGFRVIESHWEALSMARQDNFLRSQLSSPAERVALLQPREIYIKQAVSLLPRKIVLADFAAREKPSHHEFCGFGGVSKILRE